MKIFLDEVVWDKITKKMDSGLLRNPNRLTVWILKLRLPNSFLNSSLEIIRGIPLMTTLRIQLAELK